MILLYSLTSILHINSMRKYFYIESGQTKGPVSKEEVEALGLPSETLVWYFGLDGWIPLGEVDEFRKEQIVPPPLPVVATVEDLKPVIQSEKKSQRGRRRYHIRKKTVVGVVSVVCAVALLALGIFMPSKAERQHRRIAESSYDDPDVDFDFYVEKYYRDLEFDGINPVRPKSQIIRFADLDKMEDTKEYEGISYGINQDDKIEIYINPSSWEKFTKPMKYWVMYHELSHDVLNVDDLPDTEENKGKLMYPYVSKDFTMYTGMVMTMDYFIEHFHSFLEEYKAAETKEKVGRYLDFDYK